MWISLSLEFRVSILLAGHVIIGGVSSWTCINCIHVLELPQSSVADQVRVIKKVCGPNGVITSVYVMVTEASQLSVAVAVPVVEGNVVCEHSMDISGGQVITGARLSSTAMI